MKCYYVSDKEGTAQKTKKEKKVMRKLKQMLLACVLGVVVFALSGCGSTTIDLNKYVTVEAEGYDSMGTLTCTFDYDAFEKDYDGKIKANVKSNDGGTGAMIALELGFGGEVTDALLGYCVDYQPDKRSELSNGDVVNIKWDCEDEDAKKYFNVQLKYSDIKYTVKGLTEVGTFDPFEYVSVEFSGASPNGTAAISQNYDKTEMQYISFSADKNSMLSNGDKVTVTAKVQGSVDNFVKQFGAIPNPLSKEFTVEGLPAYVASSSEIDEGTLNAMKQQAEDVFTATWFKLEGSMDGLKGLTYVGNYFLSKKDGARGDENCIYLVYKVDAEFEGSTYPYYHFTKFSNIMANGEGSCIVDLNSYETATHRYTLPPIEGYIAVYYYGYETLDELHGDCVLSQIDAYTFENNVNN